MRRVPIAQRSRKRLLSKGGRFVLACYFVILILGIALVWMVGTTGEARVYQSRSQAVARPEGGVAFRREKDDAAPLGYVEKYSFNLGTISPGTTTIAFYVSHCYVNVKLDGSKVYSLMPANYASLVSPGSVYATISIDGDDSGKKVEVELVPVVAGVQQEAPTFYVGSFFQIYRGVMMADLLQIILCFIAFVLGFVYLGVGIWQTAHHRHRIDIILLGMFAVLLGVWKLFDTEYAALLFAQRPRLIMTISLEALAMLPPLTLGYFSYRLRSAPKRLLSVVGAFSVICIAIMEVLLGFGIAGVRQTLVFTHVSVVVTAAVLVYSMIRELHRGGLSTSMKMLTLAGLLVAAGSAVDFISFYTGWAHKAGSMAELVVVLIYVLVDGIVNGTDLSQRARRDSQTGVANRSACFDLLDDPTPLEAGTGFLMLDLNGLKETNDAQGHEAGDKLIVRLAHALLKVAPRDAFVGRSGGDEFICVIENAAPEQLEWLIAAIHSAANQNPEEGLLSFSSGWALSHEGETMRELSVRADGAMYKDKEAYYQGTHERRHRGEPADEEPEAGGQQCAAAR